MKAVRSSKISNQDLRSRVPMIVLMSLGGPTDDFVLGRVFEHAAEDAVNKTFTSGDTDYEITKQKALKRVY
jgi:hypothetical protein